MAEAESTKGASETPFRTPYPSYRVLAKWDTPSFNDATRRVVAHRLNSVPKRRFFSLDDYALLRAIVDCILPQPERSESERIQVEAYIDEMLEANRGSGTRYADAPTQRQAWRRGLAGSHAPASVYEVLHRCATGVANLDTLETDSDADRFDRLRDTLVLIVAARPFYVPHLAQAPRLALVHHQGVGYPGPLAHQQLPQRLARAWRYRTHAGRQPCFDHAWRHAAAPRGRVTARQRSRLRSFYTRSRVAVGCRVIANDRRRDVEKVLDE